MPEFLAKLNKKDMEIVEKYRCPACNQLLQEGKNNKVHFSTRNLINCEDIRECKDFKDIKEMCDLIRKDKEEYNKNVGCGKEYFKYKGNWYRERKTRKNLVHDIVDVLGLEEKVVGKWKENEEGNFFVERKSIYQTRGIEAKASVGDFRSGYCKSFNYSYVITPRNLISVKELELNVGLIEVDLDKFVLKNNIIDVKGIKVKKRPIYKDYYGDRCNEVIFNFLNKIAVKNTNIIINKGIY